MASLPVIMLPQVAGTGTKSAGDSVDTNTNGSGSTGPNESGGSARTSDILLRIYTAAKGREVVTNTEDYLNATVRIVSDTGTELLQVLTEIHSRGNTTWSMPKQPYRLKLEQAAPVLGVPAERD